MITKKGFLKGFGTERVESTTEVAVASHQAQPSSVISVGAEIQGDFNLSGAMHIDGAVSGNVCAVSVVIGSSGRFTGALTAEEVVVAGHVEGEITCTQLKVIAAAVVNADIRTRVQKNR